MRNNWPLTWRMTDRMFLGPRQTGLNRPVWSAGCVRSLPACASRILLNPQPWMVHPHLPSAGGPLQLILPVGNKILSSLATSVCGKAAGGPGSLLPAVLSSA